MRDALQSTDDTHWLGANLESALRNSFNKVERARVRLHGIGILRRTHQKAFNTLRPRQNGRRFADDMFKRIFLNENV